MGHKIINGHFACGTGKNKKQGSKINYMDKTSYFETLYKRFGHLQPDREKFMELMTAAYGLYAAIKRGKK